MEKYLTFTAPASPHSQRGWVRFAIFINYGIPIIIQIGNSDQKFITIFVQENKLMESV